MTADQQFAVSLAIVFIGFTLFMCISVYMSNRAKQAEYAEREQARRELHKKRAEEIKAAHRGASTVDTERSESSTRNMEHRKKWERRKQQERERERERSRSESCDHMSHAHRHTALDDSPSYSSGCSGSSFSSSGSSFSSSSDSSSSSSSGGSCDF